MLRMKDLKSQVLFKGDKVAVAVQELMLLPDTDSRQEAVHRSAHCVSECPELAVVSGAGDSILCSTA